MDSGHLLIAFMTASSCFRRLIWMSMRAGKVEYCRVGDTEEHISKNTQLLSADYSWGTTKCWQSTAACGGNRYQFPHQLRQRALCPLKTDTKSKKNSALLMRNIYSTTSEHTHAQSCHSSESNQSRKHKSSSLRDVKRSSRLLFAKVGYKRSWLPLLRFTFGTDVYLVLTL